MELMGSPTTIRVDGRHVDLLSIAVPKFVMAYNGMVAMARITDRMPRAFEVAALRLAESGVVYWSSHTGRLHVRDVSVEALQ